MYLPRTILDQLDDGKDIFDDMDDIDDILLSEYDDYPEIPCEYTVDYWTKSVNITFVPWTTNPKTLNGIVDWICLQNLFTKQMIVSDHVLITKSASMNWWKFGNKFWTIFHHYDVNDMTTLHSAILDREQKALVKQAIFLLICDLQQSFYADKKISETEYNRKFSQIDEIAQLLGIRDAYRDLWTTWTTSTP